VIPNSIATFLGFLFLVAPGLAYDMHRERNRPAMLQQSTFREASRVALSSLLLTLGALAILYVVQRVATGWLPDPYEWYRVGSDYASQHPRETGIFFVGELLIAQALAWVAAGWLGRNDRADIRQGDIWHKAFAADVPPDRDVQVLVLTENAEYRGILSGYTVNADFSNRELELQEPIKYRLPHWKESQLLPEPYERVIIPASAIKELWAHSRIEKEPSASTRMRMLTWMKAGPRKRK
jgi:Family of unknown function (DUF6338)